jgi:flagellar hook protein FlgE
MQAGALEESNVDLTAQLVQLIKAQSNYQANAKTVTTESTILQTTIQMG